MKLFYACTRRTTKGCHACGSPVFMRCDGDAVVSELDVRFAQDVDDRSMGMQRGATASRSSRSTDVLDFFIRQFPRAGAAQYSVRHSLLLSYETSCSKSNSECCNSLEGIVLWFNALIPFFLIF